MKAANSGLTFLDRCARRCQISRSPDVTAFFEFDEVDVFTTGTLGEPGQRVFFLQARSDGKRYSIRCEKQQVAAIVMHLRRVLDDDDDSPATDDVDRGTSACSQKASA